VRPSLAAASRDSKTDLTHSQLSRSLLESLEQEAVAADEEACLQELQVHVLSSTAPCAKESCVLWCTCTSLAVTCDMLSHFCT